MHFTGNYYPLQHTVHPKNLENRILNGKCGSIKEDMRVYCLHVMMFFIDVARVMVIIVQPLREESYMKCDYYDTLTLC